MKDSVKPFSENRFRFHIYITAGIAALAGLLFGYDTGVISGAILFIKDQFSLSSGAIERVVSSVLFGAMIGAAFSGALADRFGRKKVLLTTGFLFAVGAIGASMASGVGAIIGFRFLIGVSIGVASYTAPLYISEISPPNARGALVSLNQLMITFGIVVSYLVDYMLSTGESGWRWMFGLGAIPAIVLVLGMIALTESPKWLVSKNRIEEARKALARTMSPDKLSEEIKTIQNSLDAKPSSWKDVLAPWVRPTLIVGIALAFFQQLTGINTIIYYAPTIFEFAGFSSHKVSILATVGVGVVNVLMTIVAIWFIDRIGRKPLLYIGMTGMAISLGILGLAFYMPQMAEALKMLTVLSVVLYIASFAISLGPIFWLIISEIYPLGVRGRAMSIATLANWGFNLVVASTFLTFIDKLGKAGTFWLYAVICVTGLIFCYLYVPETKGRSLEDIENFLKKDKGLRAFGMMNK
ncbi:MAG: sugar porter family MFS transporter [Candidatus Omnitrophica bacterium]|nr:sugar porter family MFS transporter [Candidatus Omnitrophota bacterium]MBU1809120.1 sugar porter family MFS transporter [Candidatus Omnitrophota bacterium]